MTEKFNLGDQVKTQFDNRVATIVAILDDPIKGGHVRVLENISIYLLRRVPAKPIQPKEFTNDTGDFADEPIYLIQGQDWWGWFVIGELIFEPKQLDLM